MRTSALILVLLVASASATTGYKKANSTTRTSPSNRDSVTAKSSRSDFPHHGYEHHYPHHYGGYGGGHLGGFGHHKEFEHYLLPLLLVLGLGVLCMPLLSVLMTTMVGNVPVTTLVSGRKRREAPLNPFDEETLTKLWKKVGQAIEIFTKKDK